MDANSRERADRLNDESFVVDAHFDLPWDVANQRERGREAIIADQYLERFRTGGFDLIVAAMMASRPRSRWLATSQGRSKWASTTNDSPFRRSARSREFASMDISPEGITGIRSAGPALYCNIRSGACLFRVKPGHVVEEVSDERIRVRRMSG